MALNVSKLEKELLDIYQIGSQDSNEVARKIINSLTDFIFSVELNRLTVPGINPLPSPVIDPTFVPSIPKPVISRNVINSILYNAFLTNINTNLNSPLTTWILLENALISILITNFTTFTTSNGYSLTGTVAPGLLNLKNIFDVKYENYLESSRSLSRHMYTFLNTSIFTGIYNKAAFVGPNPHISNFI